MKFSATILTDQIDRTGECMDLSGVHAGDEIPVTRRFGALRNDRIGHAHVSSITPMAIRVDGDIDNPVLLVLYAAPGGIIEATEMRDGAQVITKFRIMEISLTTQHADSHVPPIEVAV